MPEFPHLNFSQTINAPYKRKPRGGKRELNERTAYNLNNRSAHGKNLTGALDNLSSTWAIKMAERAQSGLPDLPNPNVTPLFLQVDPEKFDIEALKGFGIEIIAEEENGYIIGASATEFYKLRAKIDKFVQERPKATNTSQLWQIVDGSRWRIEQILSEELQQKWESISDDEQLIVDIGIACYIKISDAPYQATLTDSEYKIKYDTWLAKKRKTEIQRTELEMERQTQFETLVNQYGGEFLTSYENFEDCFTIRIKIAGIGLKDIVFNYPYLFEVSEPEETEDVTAANEAGVDGIAIDIIAPDEDAPKVCVIDSGIQENHALLQPAILQTRSYSFVPGDTDVADKVNNGGHGTRVGSAILYPSGIPSAGPYQLPCYIVNMRVLDTNNDLSLNLYPPDLMQLVCTKNPDIKIFNLSVASKFGYRTTHMSSWAAAIDKLMWENDILFVLAAGNMPKNYGYPNNPGILHYLHYTQQSYPDFLLNKSSKIANPAQSCFALTVGSVYLAKFDDLDKESFGGKDGASVFSRTGPGIWGMIKPDVVEYGGDFVVEKLKAQPNLSLNDTVCPELARSTLYGGYGVGRDYVGTSYAAPKVSNIAAALQKNFPDLSALMYRSLIVQSARWPEFAFNTPALKWLRHFGYGIPNVGRAIENSPRRITFMAEGNINAINTDIYTISIPDQIRRPGDDFNILMEITLSYKANIRRTRKRTQSYLSTWLTWETSKLQDDTLEKFKERIIKKLEAENYEEDLQEPNNGEADNGNTETIKWTIHSRKDWGIEGVRRQDSTLQKDWSLIKSFNLPKELCVAVVGHKGWEKDITKEVPYAITVSFEVLNSEINLYEMIKVENEVETEVEIET